MRAKAGRIPTTVAPPCAVWDPGNTAEAHRKGNSLHPGHTDPVLAWSGKTPGPTCQTRLGGPQPPTSPPE